MERRLLQPEQIIVPGEYELGNESILKIYFRVFDRGHGADLPPVVVVRGDIVSEKQRQKRLEQRIVGTLERREREFHENYESLKKELTRDYARFASLTQESPYFLLDGNHKSAAATLTHSPMYALELQSSRDIAEVRKMIKRGELFDFKRPETSLKKLVVSFEEYCLGSENLLGRGEIDDVRMVRQRIDELTSNGDLPQYMKERYHKEK